MAAETLDARSLHAGTLTPPTSKSDAQRALALAHTLGDPLIAPMRISDDLPMDVRALARGLEALRAGLPTPIDVGDGGAPLRILLGQAAICSAPSMITGSLRLAERPHDALLESLTTTLSPAGLRIERGAPLFPLRIHPITTLAKLPRFSIRSAESSQFATSLLIAAAGLARREGRSWEVVLEGELASEGYLDLTFDWLDRAGVSYERQDARITISPSAATPRRGPVPGDWSSLGYLLVVAWKTGSDVRLVDVQAAHPDRAILDVLAQAGLTVEHGAESRVVGVPTSGVRASGHDCPDLLPTIAALACVLPGPTTLDGVPILRLKESDRLAGIEALVKAGGARSRRVHDTLVIEPGVVPENITLSSRGDHRMAMSAATLAVLANATLTLDDTHVVAKSFPHFWDELANVGVRTPA
ncbi:MAG: 3-phosphoshikimate 1-carboxyvinyltransferase [Polyangia bacterium]